MLRIMILTLFCVVISICSTGQSKTALVKELKIGDTLPDIVIPHFLSGPDRGATTGELYRRGLLLIDFWTVYCTVCIEAMPELDSLAGLFRKRFSVLSINAADSATVSAFLVKRKDLPISHLNIAANGTLFKRYFPHIFVPHLVWIDSFGVVKYITSEWELTLPNLKAFLAGKSMALTLKRDALHFNQNNSFHVGDSDYLYRSVITRTADTLTSGLLYITYRGSRMFAQNRRITDLFWIAYTRQLNDVPNWNLIELHTKDSVKFYFPRDNFPLFNRSKYHIGESPGKERYLWEKDNLYNYDIVLPADVDMETFSKYIYQDLERVFHIQATTRKKPLLCNVLERIPCSGCKTPLPSRDSGAIFIQQGNSIQLRGFRIVDFLSLKQQEFPGPPFVNKTGLTGYYDLDLETQCTSYITMDCILDALLKQYGIRCTRKIMPYPILVLWDHSRPPAATGKVK